MNNKVLGFCGLAGAPWLFLGMTLEEKYSVLKGTWFTGAWELLYITGWMCSVIALQRAKVTGESRFGKGILWVLLASLSIANVSNLLLLIIQKNQPGWWYALDMFWPISNLIMLVTGIVVVRAKILQGWQRWVPLLTGLWLPLTILSTKRGQTDSFLPAGIYSMVAWSVLAFVVITLKNSGSPYRATAKEPVLG